MGRDRLNSDEHFVDQFAKRLNQIVHTARF